MNCLSCGRFIDLDDRSVASVSWRVRCPSCHAWAHFDIDGWHKGAGIWPPVVVTVGVLAWFWLLLWLPTVVS